MTRTLRPYQAEAVADVRAEWAAGRTRTAVVLPTGCGKTDVIGKLATDEAAAGGRVLVLAHRGELLDQIAERCGMHAPIPVGRVQADVRQVRRAITVAMTPTLASTLRAMSRAVEQGDRRGIARLNGRLPGRPTMVIVDECHHAASPSYVEVLRWAGSFDGVRTVGVTATLTRADKRGLGDVFESCAHERSIPWAVDEGWLVRPHGRVVVGEHMDLAAAKVSRGDYQDGELGEMVAQDVDQIVKAWCEHAADRITVAFTPNVDSARALAEEFRGAGVPVGEVYGTTPPGERRRTYADLAAGRLRVLVSVMVTTEGWDCPPVSCVLMARPTKLPGLYAQIVGRGLRPSLATGKRDCLVLDVVGASRTQRLVTLVDLHPSAQVDRSELDALPCEVCGGWVGKVRPPELEHLDPCSCEVEDEGAARDPDGGRRRLLGPAVYDDVDLFATSSRNWLVADQGVRFLPARDRLVFLWPDSGDPACSPTWSVTHVAARGTPGGEWLDDGVPHTLDEARALAERWATEYDPSTSARKASWRSGRPSDKQVAYARSLGVVDPEGMNRARVADEISIRLASRRLRMAGVG